MAILKRVLRDVPEIRPKIHSREVSIVKERLTGKRISRRQFMSRGLWTGLAAGFFSGALFSLRDQSEKRDPGAVRRSLHEARFYSKLAG
jgi:hypothetical protein